MVLFKSFLKTLLTTERRLAGKYFLVVGLPQTLLYAMTTNETSQQSGKQDSFRYPCKKLASMY